MVSWKKVISYAGAFIAFLIGSGFATGQEIMQYFASQGYPGLATALVMFLMFLYVGVSFITTGYREQFERPNDIFYVLLRQVCGGFF